MASPPQIHKYYQINSSRQHLSHTEEQPALVLVYLRKSNKKSQKIQIAGETSIGEIGKIAEAETGIQRKDMIIYLNGNKYSCSESRMQRVVNVNLKPNDIIHIHNKGNIPKEKMNLNIQIFSKNSRKLISQPFGVMATHKIKTFIHVINQSYPELEKNKITLIQSGRKLSEEKTFYDEDIEDNSYISIFIDKQLNRLADKKQEIKEDIKEFEFNDGVITVPENSQSKYRKCVSLDMDLAYFEATPNFKKKQKGSMMYKSSPKQTQGIEQIWESDSSGGSEQNKKQLLKVLSIKKQKENKNEKTASFLKKSAEKFEHEKFTVKDRLQLKQEIKKLFQSESLSTGQTQIKKLQPPKINTDQFIEEIEEMEFCESQSEKPSKRDIPELKLPFEIGFDLRQSVGKNKGKGSIEELIPTRDFDIDDNIDEMDMDF